LVKGNTTKATENEHVQQHEKRTAKRETTHLFVFDISLNYIVPRACDFGHWYKHVIDYVCGCLGVGNQSIGLEYIPGTFPPIENDFGLSICIGRGVMLSRGSKDTHTKTDRQTGEKEGGEERRKGGKERGREEESIPCAGITLPLLADLALPSFNTYT
jgi:hypothetical protein